MNYLCTDPDRWLGLEPEAYGDEEEVLLYVEHTETCLYHKNREERLDRLTRFVMDMYLAKRNDPELS